MVKRATTSIALAIAVAMAAAPVHAADDPVKTTSSFTADGITVVLSPSPSPLVSVIVGFEGGLATGDASNPEIGPFASDLITSSGSEEYPKQKLRTFNSRTSTRIWGEGGRRELSFRMLTTRGNFDEAWDVFSSIIRRPAFDADEFRTVKAQRLASVKSRWSRPDQLAYGIADSLLTLGHPVLGREVYPADVEALGIDALRDFVRKTSERSRMLVVVVGDVSREEITKKLASFTSLPLGSYTRRELAPLTGASRPTMGVTDLPHSPTTYIYGAFAGPRQGDPDYWPLSVGLRHLRDVLFEEIRTKRNLSYAPGSFLASELGNGIGFVSVTSTLPDSAITVIYNELEKMRRGEFTVQDLENTKEAYLTSYYMRRMTAQEQASALYDAQRNSGDWRQAFAYDAILSVDKQAVQRAFDRYARNLSVGVVGKKAVLSEDRYMFAE